jgi:hypothetical protein
MRCDDDYYFAFTFEGSGYRAYFTSARDVSAGQTPHANNTHAALQHAHYCQYRPSHGAAPLLHFSPLASLASFSSQIGEGAFAASHFNIHVQYTAKSTSSPAAHNKAISHASGLDYFGIY